MREITGESPAILLETDPCESSLTKTYIYVADPPSLGRADGEILAQHDGDISDARYFYLHDRLDSVFKTLPSARERAVRPLARTAKQAYPRRYVDGDGRRQPE